MINRLLVVNMASLSLLIGAVQGMSEPVVILCHFSITLFIISMSPVFSILIESKLKIESYLLFIAFSVLIFTLSLYYSSATEASIALFIIIAYFMYCLIKVKLKTVNIDEKEIIEISFFHLVIEKKKELLLFPSLIVWLSLNILISIVSFM